jgi:hypothetical protein
VGVFQFAFLENAFPIEAGRNGETQAVQCLTGYKSTLSVVRCRFLRQFLFLVFLTAANLEKSSL